MAVKKQQTQNKSKFDKNFAKPRKGEKWSDIYYVRIYRLARQGFSDTQIGKTLGVDKVTFYRWRDSNPAVQDALAQARTEEDGAGNLAEYVHGRLPPSLQELWAEIMEVDQLKDDSVYMRRKRVEKLLADKGRRVKQQLWLHALVHSNFNKFDACRKVNVSRGTVQNWIKGDPKFMELMDAVIEMKKDFAEGCLFGLVGQGDVTATVFVNRTLNRDRGYDPKITIVNEGTVKHAHYDINKIVDSLPTDAKRAFLAAMQTANSDPKALPPRKVEVRQIHDGEDDE